jgi:hypothetical protein
MHLHSLLCDIGSWNGFFGFSIYILGKLKDLGNSLLGNFGLSLDNFKTVQDPKTGSYNIQFEQGGNKK